MIDKSLILSYLQYIYRVLSCRKLIVRKATQNCVPLKVSLFHIRHKLAYPLMSVISMLHDKEMIFFVLGNNCRWSWESQVKTKVWLGMTLIDMLMQCSHQSQLSERSRKREKKMLWCNDNILYLHWFKDLENQGCKIGLQIDFFAIHVYNYCTRNWKTTTEFINKVSYQKQNAISNNAITQVNKYWNTVNEPYVQYILWHCSLNLLVL